MNTWNKRRGTWSQRDKVILIVLLLLVLLALALGVYFASRGLHPRQLRRHSPHAENQDLPFPSASVFASSLSPERFSDFRSL